MYYDSYDRPHKKTVLDYCLDYWWVSLFIIFFGALVFIDVYTEEKQVGATVLEHNVVGHRSTTEYSTLIKTDDGYLQTVHDLRSYVVPVNGRLYITKRVLKK